ncbi:hypothetical protein ACJJTC_019403 [Scirpophaga incertulas]
MIAEPPDAKPTSVDSEKGLTKSQKNLYLWTTSPLIEVGSGDCPLDQAPKGVDTIGLTGCKTQSYTSWNTLGRDFIPCITYPPPTKNINATTERHDTNLITDPSHASVLALGRIAVRKVHDKKYGYDPTNGSLVRITSRPGRSKRSIDDDLASSVDRDGPDPPSPPLIASAATSTLHVPNPSTPLTSQDGINAPGSTSRPESYPSPVTDNSTKQNQYTPHIPTNSTSGLSSHMQREHSRRWCGRPTFEMPPPL